MNKFLLASLVASTALVSPAQAQDSDAAALRAQIAAMQAQIDEMAARLDQMEAAAPPAAVASPSASGNGVEISFNGAPEIEAPGGWSFKPFGRLNMDAGILDLPVGLGRPDGFGSEFRRARLGMEGDIPGGFGYKIEVEFIGGAEVTDAYLTYGDGGLTITAGQHNTFQSLEELSSDNWTSFTERAAFTDAFGFERRLGLSAQYSSGDLLFQAGLFTDNAADLPNKTWSLDGRAVFAPQIGSTQLHLGASFHLTSIESGGTVRYRQRPFVHFTAERVLSTSNIPATREVGTGLEAALISGRFHAAGEAFRQHVSNATALFDPSFFGGYVEVGYYLTSGDSRGYRNGRWNRTRPANPVDEGGPGAWQVNLRYDRLDLNDGPITGGTQDGYFASIVWVPTDYTRLLLNYGHLQYDDAALPLTSGSRSWSADVLALRGQIDF